MDGRTTGWVVCFPMVPWSAVVSRGFQSTFLFVLALLGSILVLVRSPARAFFPILFLLTADSRARFGFSLGSARWTLFRRGLARWPVRFWSMGIRLRSLGGIRLADLLAHVPFGSRLYGVSACGLPTAVYFRRFLLRVGFWTSTFSYFTFYLLIQSQRIKTWPSKVMKK